MKKIMLLICTMVLCFCFSSVVFASDETSYKFATEDIYDVDNYTTDEYEKIIEQAPDFFSEERQAKVRALQEQIAEEYSVKSSSVAYILTPFNYMQEDTSWCGPAVAKSIIYYKEEISNTQTSLANDMDTDGSGTYVYQMANRINEDLSSGEYYYLGTWESDFETDVESSIDDDMPVVGHVGTRYLPNYNGYNCWHYICIKGYDYDGSDPEVIYNDPHYNNYYYGAYWTDVETMEDSIDYNAGFYIMGSD